MINAKKIEENNRMGKTRDLFKKIRDTGNISCNDGLNKGQKWYGPNRSRRYKEEVARIHRTTTQRGLNDPDNHNGESTYIEHDVLECHVKWALGSIITNKASGLEKVGFHSNPKECLNYCTITLISHNT